MSESKVVECRFTIPRVLSKRLDRIAEHKPFGWKSYMFRRALSDLIEAEEKRRKKIADAELFDEPEDLSEPSQAVQDYIYPIGSSSESEE